MKLSSEIKSSSKPSLSEPSETKETTFVEEDPSDDEALLIEKSSAIKETSFLFKMRPRVSRLPFKK